MSHSVLLAYAKGMQSAQRLEGRLKLLFALYKTMDGVSKRNGPLLDGEVESLLLAGDRITFGAALKGILQIASPSLPEKTLTALWQTVRTRNFLAHHYFSARNLLVTNESSQPYLVAELDWFSELFECWAPALDKWTDSLLVALGVDDAELRSMQSELEQLAPEIQKQELESLKNMLSEIGIDVPSPPNQAQPCASSDVR